MSEALDAIREICTDIAKRVDRKYVAMQARHNEPATKLWDLWVESGLSGLGLAEELGGIGGDTTDLLKAIDWLAQDGLFLPTVVPHFMSLVPLAKHGNDVQRKTLLAGTTTGDVVFSFAITEPEAGTNTFKIQTKATRETDGSYRLSGSKHFITNFLEATHCLVVARTSPHDSGSRTSGLTIFIIEPDAPGVSADKMDIGVYFPEKQYRVNFDDVVVTPESILGKLDRGIDVLFDCLNPERLIVAAGNIGNADYVLSKAAEYAKERAPFDVPIGAYQSVQHPMAVAKINIEAARALLYQAAAAFDEGRPIGLEANMTKYLASQAYSQATSAAAAVYGGSFADLETDLIPYLLQAKLNEVAPVNNNILLSHIAQNALGLPKSY